MSFFRAFFDPERTDYPTFVSEHFRPEVREDVLDLLHEMRLIHMRQVPDAQVRVLGRDRPYLGLAHSAPSGISYLNQIHQSDVSFQTKQSSGLAPEHPKTIRRLKCSNKSITDMVKNRECGQLKGYGFSNVDRRIINNHKLPVGRTIVDTYDNKAFCGIYSHDGNILLTAAQDRYLRTYDSTNGHTFRKLQTIQGRDIGWSVLDCTFSPDSTRIAYSSWSNSLHMVDVHTGDNGRHVSLPLSPEERRFCVFSLLFTNSGSEIICGANDGHMYVYDLIRNCRTSRVEAHREDLNTIAFADETHQIIYSGGDDGICKIWDRRIMSEESPVPVGVLVGHLDGITFIDSRNDGRHFISNSKDQSIKLWDIRITSSEAAQENRRKAAKSGTKWDYRWQCAPRNLSARRVNIKGDTSIATYRGHSVLQTLIRCRFSPQFSTGQRYITTGCSTGRVITYDILTGKIAEGLKGHRACVRDVTWHPWKPELISCGWDFTVVCWNHYGIGAAKEDPKNEDPEEEPEEEEEEEWNSHIHLRRSLRLAERAATVRSNNRVLN